MPNIALITNNIITELSGTSSQVALGNGTLTDFKLDSLTDVNVPTPGDGDVLKWNATTLLWEASDSAGITGSGVAGQVAYFTGATTQGGSNNLFWDNTNGRLGIGTNTPSVFLNVVGSGLTTAIFSYSGTDGAINSHNTGTLAITRTAQIRLVNGSTLFGANDRTYQLVNIGRSGTVADFYVQYYDGTSYLDRFRVFGSTGNFGINTGASDSGQRLQVIGDTLMKGSGATSGTNGLTIQDSAGVNIYTFRNDGQAISSIRNAQTEASLRFTQVTANNNAGTSIPIIWYENNAASQRAVINGVWDASNRAGFNFNHGQGTTGVSILLNNPSNQTIGGSTFTINETFNPTSGTAFRVFANIAPTINQTGGANGITYGLSVNPTITAAADWRSITWTNNTGWGLYGQGTANNYIAGSLGIGTTTITAPLQFGKAVYADPSSENFFRIKFEDFGGIQNDVGIGQPISSSLGINLGSATGYFSIYRGTNGESLRLTPFGNLIIQAGGTYTDSGERLQVTGTAKITSTLSVGDTSTTNIVNITGGAASNAELRLINGTTRQVRFASRGDISQVLLDADTWDLGIRTVSSKFIFFATNGTERMRLDASGNLGLGVTPSAWRSAAKAFQVGTTSSVYNVADGTFIGNNVFSNSTAADIYIKNGPAGVYGQTNTGSHIWGVAASGTAGNAITFTQAMTLDASGNLGIGTTSPRARLHTLLNGNASNGITGTTLIGQNSSSGNSSYLTLVGAFDADAGIVFTDESVAYKGRIVYSNNNEFMSFWTDGSERSRIFSTGNIAIGSTTDSGEKLQVTGTAKITGAATFSSSVTAGAFIPSGATIPTNGMYLPAADSIALSTTSTQRFRITSGGNIVINSDSIDNGTRFQVIGTGYISSTLGVGTLATYKLDVLTDGDNGIRTTSSAGQQLYLGNSAGTGVVGTLNNYSLGIITNSSIRATIDTNGNFGIGVSPSYKLHVSNNANSPLYIGATNTTAGNASAAGLLLTSNTASGSAEYQKRSSTATTYKTLSSNDLAIFNTTAGDITLLNDHINGKIEFAAGGASTPQITIDSAGRLLIGTTASSTYKLDVVGDAMVSGSMVINTDTLFVDSGTQRVGIGTTSATGKLHVNGSLGSFRVLDSGAEVYFSRDNNNDIYANGGSSAAISIGAQNHVRFLTGTTLTERMRLDASGNLGLGVTPSAWHSGVRAMQVGLASSIASRTGGSGLYIGDNYYFSTDPSTGPSTAIYLYSAAAATYRIASGQHQWYNAPSGTAGNAITFTQAMTLFSTGNLAVGTTTDAGFKLDVNGTMRVSGASTLSGGVTLGHTGGLAVTFPGGQAFRSNGGIFIDYGNGGTGDLVFRRGVGVTNTLTLAVADGAATFSSSVTAQTGLFGGNLGGANQRVANFRNSGGNAFIELQSSGAGAVALWAASANEFGIYQNATAGTIGTNVFYITSAANIGIGTFTPSYKLDVNGTFGATGAATFSGNLTVDTNTLFVDSSANRVGIGTVIPSFGLHINTTGGSATGIGVTSDTANDTLYYGSGTVTGSVTLIDGYYNATGSILNKLTNTNTSTGSSILSISVAAASTGDPYVRFSTNGIGATDWSIGIDNSDSDKFKIGYYQSPSTGSLATFTTTGRLGIGTESPAEALDVAGAIKTASGGHLGYFTGSSAIFTNAVSYGSATGFSITHVSESGLTFGFGSSQLLVLDGSGGMSIPYTNGLKIGTLTSQKIGFWNATPIVQPTTSVASATRTAGGGNTVTDSDTFDGYTIAKVVKALRDTGILA
jgi:hypothetical protein